MSRYKRFRVKIVVTKEVHAFFEIDAASPDHAQRVVREAFRKDEFHAPGLCGTQDLGWKLLTKKGDPFVEEIPKDDAS